MVRNPVSPVSEGVVGIRSATFNTWELQNPIFRTYEKACLILDLPTDWLTNIAIATTDGLFNATCAPFKFPNCARLVDLLRILKNRPPIGNELAQLCFLSYIFSLRIPSATLMLSRYFANDKIAEYSPQEHKSLICIRDPHDVKLKVVKFAFRGIARNGCISKRPRRRTAKIRKRKHFPTPRYLGLHKKTAEDRRAIPPSFTKSDINRKIKHTTALAGCENAGRYSPHAFRSGVTQEILVSGSTLAIILTS